MNCQQCGAPIPHSKPGETCFYCGKDPTVAGRSAAPSSAGLFPAAPARPVASVVVLVALALVSLSSVVVWMLTSDSAEPDVAPPPVSERPAEPTLDQAGSDHTKTGVSTVDTTREADAAIAAKDPAGSALLDAGALSGGKVKNAAAVVARMRGRFRRCYEQGLSEHPDMQGTVQLEAMIAPDGRVTKVTDSGDPSLAPVVPCLKAVVSSGSFAEPTGGVALVAIPITFVKQD